MQDYQKLRTYSTKFLETWPKHMTSGYFGKKYGKRRNSGRSCKVKSNFLLPEKTVRFCGKISQVLFLTFNP